MKTKLIAIAVVGASLILGACSSTHKQGDASTGYDSASAQGTGDRSNFGGETGLTYTTQAPRDQIYYFSYDDATVEQKYAPSIEAQAQYAASHTGAKILIAGNTDERGSREYNIALGERRADAIANMMRMAGVQPDQLRVVSYGEERPAAQGSDEDAYRLNRRDELTYEATS